MKKTVPDNRTVKTLGSFAAEQFKIALADYHSGLRQSWHKHDDFVLVMILKGFVRERVAARDELIKPLAVGLKSPDVRHTDHFWDNGVRVIRIALDAAFVAEMKDRSLIEEGWNWLEDSRPARPFLRIADSLLRQNTNEREISEQVFEVLGAMSPRAKAVSGARHAPLWLRRAKEHLETSFADGVRLTALAAEAGVHPVYFARQFREFYGCSVGRYVRRLQFQKAAALLAARRYKLADIAGRVGCADQAHLSRLFAGEFGLTPKQFRRLAG